MFSNIWTDLERKQIMLREKMLCIVKDELSEFVDCLHINEYQDYSNDFDHCAENIVDRIFEEKGNYYER